MEVATAVEVARRGALPLDTARLFNRQQTVAEKLHRSVLTDPPQPDDLELDVRYRPAVRVLTAKPGRRHIRLRGLASTRMTARQKPSAR